MRIISSTDATETRDMRTWLDRAWKERQFRITYRAVLAGLVARNEPGEPEEIAKKASRLAKAALLEMVRQHSDHH